MDKVVLGMWFSGKALEQMDWSLDSTCYKNRVKEEDIRGRVERGQKEKKEGGRDREKGKIVKQSVSWGKLIQNGRKKNTEQIPLEMKNGQIWLKPICR